MTPNAITLLFKEARDAFPPLKGKPMDNNLLSIRETLLPIHMEVPYDQLGGVHSLTALITDGVRYATEHGGNSFKHPVHLPLYNGSIKDNATTVVRVCAEAAHKARLDDYASFEAAERGAAKFLRKLVDKVWYNDLKDADTFYTKVTALEIILFLDANSGELHAIDVISLRTNMHQYYMQADGIPQYIIMLEEAQKRQRGLACPLPMSNSS
jgi:tRNA(Leu) C34 or U34 (ribose-2'-O)-methylase TrmL